jgi:hypothetical protein
VMIAGPVEAGEVRECLVLQHGFRGLAAGRARPACTTGRADTRSFGSLSSIRPSGGGLRRSRCSSLNLREMSALGPCLLRGVAAAGLRRHRKVIHRRVFVGGKVIHNRRLWGVRGAPLRRLMNNFGTGISALGTAAGCPKLCFLALCTATGRTSCGDGRETEFRCIGGFPERFANFGNQRRTRVAFGSIADGEAPTYDAANSRDSALNMLRSLCGLSAYSP